MTVRKVLKYGTPSLREKSKEVHKISKKIQALIEDLYDTMYATNGVGLAAPQVGILKRIVVMDVDDGNQYVLINPEILEMSGSQTGQEGCLSVPNKRGEVTRANYVKVKALNENMEEFILEGEELLARCILHECDHLDGHLYVEKVDGDLFDVSDEE